LFIKLPPIVGANLKTEALEKRQKDVAQRAGISTAHSVITNVQLGINGKTFQGQISRACKLTALEDIKKQSEIGARLKGHNLREICVVKKIGNSVREPKVVVVRRVLFKPKCETALTNILIRALLVRLSQSTKTSLVLTPAE
jgi:hypothetical protein